MAQGPPVQRATLVVSLPRAEKLCLEHARCSMCHPLDENTHTIASESASASLGYLKWIQELRASHDDIILVSPFMPFDLDTF